MARNNKDSTIEFVGQYIDISYARNITEPEWNRLYRIVRDRKAILNKSKTIKKSESPSHPRGRYNQTTETTLTVTMDQGFIVIREDAWVVNDETSYPINQVHYKARDILNNIDRVAPGFGCPPLYLSVSQIARLIPDSDSEINRHFAEHGFLTGTPGNWAPTGEGNQHCFSHQETPYSYIIRYWDLDAIREVCYIDRALNDVNMRRKQNGDDVFENLFDYYRHGRQLRLLNGATIYL